MMSQPCPGFPFSYLSNALARYSVFFCNFKLFHLSYKTSNFQYFFVCKFCVSMPLSETRSAVENGIFIVFRSSTPFQMFRRNATNISISAYMPAMYFRRTRRTIRCFTNNSMNSVHFSIYPYFTVSKLSFPIRPYQTLFSIIRFGFFHKLNKFTAIMSRWIAIFFPLLPMGSAPTTSFNFLAAAWY